MVPAERRPNRLKDYNYSQNGAYFITICVKDRRPILSCITSGDDIACSSVVELSLLGRVVDDVIQAIPHHYPDVVVDRYVIMPNHIHMILFLERGSGREMITHSGVPEIIRQMKGCITKQYGKGIWQKSYYDHIIRDEYDYLIISRYIDENPIRWNDDKFYVG